jgi:hypothetical protein
MARQTTAANKFLTSTSGGRFCEKSFCGAQAANNQCQYMCYRTRIKVAGIGLKLPPNRESPYYRIGTAQRPGAPSARPLCVWQGGRKNANIRVTPERHPRNRGLENPEIGVETRTIDDESKRLGCRRLFFSDNVRRSGRRGGSTVFM